MLICAAPFREASMVLFDPDVYGAVPFEAKSLNGTNRRPAVASSFSTKNAIAQSSTTSDL
jgi:hypothetical protein